MGACPLLDKLMIAAASSPHAHPHVVIVGAGFGGLSVAKALARAPVDVTVIDRQNHHCFQPLLYQVATAALSPAEIAWPIRAILRHQRNATVLMAEVTGIDTANRRVETTSTACNVDSASRSHSDSASRIRTSAFTMSRRRAIRSGSRLSIASRMRLW